MMIGFKHDSKSIKSNEFIEELKEEIENKIYSGDVRMCSYAMIMKMIIVLKSLCLIFVQPASHSFTPFC